MSRDDPRLSMSRALAPARAADPVFVDDEDPRADALRRLQASRLRLADALMPHRSGDRSAPGSGRPPWAAWSGFWQRHAGSGPLAPVLGTLWGVWRGWWKSQPWQPSVDLLGNAAARRFGPAVRRHPWLAVGIAAGVGALLVAARPWRRPAVAAHLGSMRRRAFRWTVRQLSSAPVQMALAGLLTVWLGETAPQDAAATQEPPGAGGGAPDLTTSAGTEDERESAASAARSFPSPSLQEPA